MFKETFITSLLTFYLKGEITADDNFVKFKNPNTILKVIPLGTTNRSVPIPQIASVDTNFNLMFKSLVLGAVIAMFSFGIMQDSFFMGLILLLFGASMVVSSFQTNLLVHTASGKVEVIDFLVFEKQKAENMAKHINDFIMQHHHNTNVAVHSAQSTEAIVNAINNNK